MIILIRQMVAYICRKVKYLMQNQRLRQTWPQVTLALGPDLHVLGQSTRKESRRCFFCKHPGSKEKQKGKCLDSQCFITKSLMILSHYLYPRRCEWGDTESLEIEMSFHCSSLCVKGGTKRIEKYPPQPHPNKTHLFTLV